MTYRETNQSESKKKGGEEVKTEVWETNTAFTTEKFRKIKRNVMKLVRVCVTSTQV